MLQHVNTAWFFMHLKHLLFALLCFSECNSEKAIPVHVCVDMDKWGAGMSTVTGRLCLAWRWHILYQSELCAWSLKWLSFWLLSDMTWHLLLIGQCLLYLKFWLKFIFGLIFFNQSNFIFFRQTKITIKLVQQNFKVKINLPGNPQQTNKYSWKI